MIPIQPVLTRPFTPYNAVHKHEFKLAARHFLRNLAKLLRPAFGEFEYEIRWNEGGVAVSGEATLHCDDLYVQVSDSALYGVPSVMYRSCKSNRDYCGNQNNFISFRSLITQEAQDRFINHCMALQAAEQQRRKSYGNL